VRTASFRRLRGFTCVAAICDECGFWYSDDSANPDVEIINAVRPMLATTNGPLIAISSPHARRGVLWEAYNRHFGASGDSTILVAQGETTKLNLEVDAKGRPKVQRHIDRLYAEDPSRAAAEYGAQFRTDLEAFVSREVLTICTDPERERPHNKRNNYVAFTDPSGGSSDSFTLAIAHTEDNIAVLDVIRETRAPFQPAVIVEDFAKVLKAYGLKTVYGDRYAGEWPPEAFSRWGITYETSELSKSEIYLAFLPMLNSQTVALLTNERLQAQFLGLERRSSSAGRDIIDHGRGGRDDVANAAAGALVHLQHVQGAVRVAGFNRRIHYPEHGIV
jgi:hypothetical protein